MEDNITADNAVFNYKKKTLNKQHFLEKYLYIYLNILVPDRPPLNISVAETGPRSAVITWSPVPQGYRNGIIKGYVLYYHHHNVRRFRQSLADRASVNITANARTFEMQIRQLKEDSFYCVQLLAFTVVGEGPLSNCSFVKTTKIQGMLSHGKKVRYWLKLAYLPKNMKKLLKIQLTFDF